MIDAIVAEAELDPRFRETLATVWLVADDFTPEILAALQAATGNRLRFPTQAELDATTDPETGLPIGDG